MKKQKQQSDLEELIEGIGNGIVTGVAMAFVPVAVGFAAFVYLFGQPIPNIEKSVLGAMLVCVLTVMFQMLWHRHGWDLRARQDSIK